ncbi:PAB-dependent poly(A)-specific ribonuclease subunit PAN2 [Termitomyces sp. J132]|nr:PAB-dependent poly(A)-specific ribonuclease subunit PAN2 [Termitomyces sp. J132]
MSTSYRKITPITLSFPQPVTSLSFDPVSDILWAGSNLGDVTGYYGTRGIRGVSFKVGGRLAVKKLVSGENHVRALGLAGEGFGTWTKGGMNKWYFRHSSNITSFSNTANSNIVASSTAEMDLLYINSLTGAVLRQTATPSIISHLHASHTSLLSGSSDGYLRTHDPRSNSSRSSENHVRAHTGGIQGLDTTGNFAFTIGLGERQSRPFPDPLVKIYDLRTMRSLPPIAFSSGPAFIHVLPKRASTIVIVSNQGLVNIVDVVNPAASEFYQLDLASYVTSCSVSATAAYVAFGDADGAIHLLSQAEDTVGVPFNGFDGKPVDWADTPAELAEIDWMDSTPLNTIGLPHYDTQLLSAWTPLMKPSIVVYPPPSKIPAQLLNTMKMKDNVAYAALPRELKGRRNVVGVESQRRHNGRFRSGKATKIESSAPVYEYVDEEVPQMYRQVEIEYSKFGVEDFDFGFYNKTEYSGLETHIFNSYTNSVLQVMHYCLPIRTLAKSHITTNCPREHCLLCELGFVVRMLEDARGTNCQSSNFCKTVGVLALASNSIELVDYGRDGIEVDYAHRIQIFHRFLIELLSSEGNSFHNPSLLKTPSSLSSSHPLSAAPITQLLSIDSKNTTTCTSCGAVREKDNMSHLVDLIYPRKGPSNEPHPVLDFVSILRHSLFRQITHKATCQQCSSPTFFISRRSIPSQDLPPILAINACIHNEENLNLWLDVRGQTFLQTRLQLHGQVGGVDDPVGVEYTIRSFVVQILTKNKQSHLVAIVRVPEAEKRTDLISPWFIFNDFVVRNIPEEEALSFPDKWKVPAIVYYERSDLVEVLDYSRLPNSIDETILCHDTSISLNRDPHLIKHEALLANELPRPGTFVAIDAEFVSMQQEETEFRSDGTKKVLRPARLSLARVSVLRGDGQKQGIPFIDDYIHTSEVIVDYLTEFSGIKFVVGDLDPHLSRHTLTPLKLVYKKLRLLVDRGCVFIGHGLSKDFRIINIYVPPEQVIDTVDLYFIRSRQRRLSLRFLSWFVLHEHIQTDAHDSIEDARSALKLYKAYTEFEEAGTFDEKLDELYAEGRLYVSCVFCHIVIFDPSRLLSRTSSRPS